MSDALLSEPGSSLSEPMPRVERWVGVEGSVEPLRPGGRASRAVEPMALPTVRPGQLWFIELPATGAHLDPLEYQVLTSVNVVIYDRALARTVASVLPLGGYAEPAPPIDDAADQALERCLRFAQDGWSVARLVDPRVKPGESSGRGRADRIRHLSERLLARKGSANSPISVFANAGGGAYEKIEVELGELHDVLDVRGAEQAVTLRIVFGAMDTGALSRFSIASANGLAG